LTYLFFVAGYFLMPGAALVSTIHPAERRWNPERTSVVTTIFFLATFTVLVMYVLTAGYGRYGAGQNGTEALANLSLLGELSMIPYAISLVRAARHRTGAPDTYMSRWDWWFLWLVMLPAQVGLSVFIGVRSRAVTLAVMAVVAFHYGYKPVRLRTYVVFGAVLLFVVTPLLGWMRQDYIMTLPEQSASYSVKSWESVAGRTSAIETLTVIYENRARVPKPDPVYWGLIMGLVPRFVWPSKPMFTFNERLTAWAVGGNNRFSWMGPTMPGELFVSLGVAGSLAFFLFLGGLWRALYEFARLHGREVWLPLYLVAIPAILSLEVGFVSPYATITRFLAVTAILLHFITLPARGRVSERKPVPPRFSRFGRAAASAS
jgi:hypothetical protein